MLLSMTGHGEGSSEADGIRVAAEVRTINSRYFKLSVRAGEGYASLESRVEGLVRETVRRGTVTLNLKIDREASPDDYRLNETVISSYRRQMEKLYDDMHVADSIHLDALLQLPGVVEESTRRHDVDADWPVIEAAITGALSRLAQMRADEGRAMADDLRENCGTIATELEQIADRAPQVVEAYRTRLTDRLSKLLSEFEVKIEAADVVREVGVFAERGDISEEIVRLRSHLDQFDSIMQKPESNGRKLDFLTQEMFRETNTIGSKANDAEIARHVIEIKAAIERMREMIQNVE